MKLFSFKKPVSFRDGQVVVEDLAYNHPYKKVDNQLVVEGYDTATKWNYKVLFSLRGELQLVILKKSQRAKVMVSWKQEFETVEIQKIKPNGDILSVVQKFVTLSNIKDKLIFQSFVLQIGSTEQQKIFTLDNGKWNSEGKITQQHRLDWVS